MNIEELITEKYLDGVIDEDHFVELLEKASLRDREYESFKVKKQSDLRPDEVEHDKQLMEKFNKLSDKEKGKMAHQFYLKGQNDYVLSPVEYKIAKNYIRDAKREDRFFKGLTAFHAGLAAVGAHEARKAARTSKLIKDDMSKDKENRNFKDLSDYEYGKYNERFKHLAKGHAGVATANVLMAGKGANDIITNKKEIEEGIKRRSKK